MFRKLIIAGRHSGRPSPLDQENEWGLRIRRDEANVEQILQSVLTATSNCIDVGAHQGVFLKRFLELSPGGRHLAFEPLPAFASALRKSFPSVEIFSCALGNRTGRVGFCHAVKLPGWSGLRTQPYPVQTEVERIEVEMRRLDDLVPSNARVDFIKVDVEGAELEVFEGARATIKQSKPHILFEHAKIHNLEYDTTPKKVYDLLVAECGLNIYCLDGTGPLTLKELKKIYLSSFSSNYDRHAQTNFLATQNGDRLRFH